MYGTLYLNIFKKVKKEFPQRIEEKIIGDFIHFVKVHFPITRNQIIESYDSETFCKFLIYAIANSYDLELEWYQKWGKYVKKELIQKSEPQAILQEGLCLPLSYKIALWDQYNPDASLDSLAAQVKIDKSDRFNYLRYSLCFSLPYEKDLDLDKQQKIMDEIYGVSKQSLVKTYSYDKDRVKSFFKKNKIQKSLELSNGVFVVWFLDHAIYVRLDEKRKIYHFFDANIGLIGNFSSAKKMFACFQDWFEKFYSKDSEDRKNPHLHGIILSKK